MRRRELEFEKVTISYVCPVIRSLDLNIVNTLFQCFEIVTIRRVDLNFRFKSASVYNSNVERQSQFIKVEIIVLFFFRKDYLHGNLCCYCLAESCICINRNANSVRLPIGIAVCHFQFFQFYLSVSILRRKFKIYHTLTCEISRIFFIKVLGIVKNIIISHIDYVVEINIIFKNICRLRRFIR